MGKYGRAEGPEGHILGAPKAGHITRLEFNKRLEKDADAREAFERQVREEKERRKAIRERELMISRCRLNEGFFSHLKIELGKLRFAVSKTQDMEDRVIELETLGKSPAGRKAYDKMQSDLVTARKSLIKLLTSDDVKATLLDMVEQNELNRLLLTLLDENITNAYQGNQVRRVIN
ncbi:Unknown protein [Striga hermonthica]|uniref:Uncharacterized protein n=1 Tax=Striga hermonthica TaxID=68872 RepID=A0A9N7RLK5_STRHE|nr:Unknown protein [Striga hermonthica]